MADKSIGLPIVAEKILIIALKAGVIRVSILKLKLQPEPCFIWQSTALFFKSWTAVER